MNQYKIRHLFFIVFFFGIFSINLNAQINESFKKQKLVSKKDTIDVAKLNPVPNSIMLFYNSNVISDSLFYFDFSNAILVIDSNLLNKELDLYYKDFAFNLHVPYAHKDTGLILKSKSEERKYYSGSPYPESEYRFNNSKLNKQGSISRGIQFGNNQDMVVNSSLNLQLSGEISDDFKVLAAITDDNIPIQPEGNTQQINDFDKVFIQVYNEKSKLIAGDYELNNMPGYFLKVNKKAQGAQFNHRIDLKEKTKLDVMVSGAGSKGKYNRMNIQGIEGNQGPYKLKGADNERYLIVIAGSEKVYINGEQMLRGTDNDYVIDYNTGEIRFTPQRIITKDSRIIVEFEYTDKKYARFMSGNSVKLSDEKNEYYFNYFIESDAKNQAIDLNLTNTMKNALRNAGDNYDRAYVPAFDSIGFDPVQIRYMLKDTVVDGNTYDSIFEYSTNPQQAYYQVSFANVGENKGNYNLKNNAAGKVYEWTAPVNGIPSGNYAPVSPVTAPQRKQMATAGANISASWGTNIGIEMAYSENDINTFSPLNDANNQSYALKCDVQQKLIKNRNNPFQLQTFAGYSGIADNFSYFDNFRGQEYERDWNISNNNNKAEHFIQTGLAADYKDIFTSKYAFNLLKKYEYNAQKNQLTGAVLSKKVILNYSASILNQEDSLYSSEFIRHQLSAKTKLKCFNIELSEMQDINMRKDIFSDSLSNTAFALGNIMATISNPDTSKNKWGLSYKTGEEKRSFENKLNRFNKYDEFAFKSDLPVSSVFQLSAIANYRKLTINTSRDSLNTPQENLTAGFENSFTLFKNIFTSNTTYEVGSGLELKNEYNYIEVAPGQGVFQWVDYDSSGTAELNEFEIASFQDQANFIRIMIPTEDYVKVYATDFNQVFNFDLNKIKSSNKVLKFVSRFSNLLSYRASRKNNYNDFNKALNPIYKSSTGFNNDTTLINVNTDIRNVLSFNKHNSKWGLDYIFNENKNKILLINGYDSRLQRKNQIKLRVNISNVFSVYNIAQATDKFYSSEFFPGKNYNINQQSNELKLQIQPGLNLRFSLSYIYEEKRNKLDLEKYFAHNAKFEVKAGLKKGNLDFRTELVKINFVGTKNTPVAYEMLKGLNAGLNGLWTLAYRATVGKNLQLSLNYNGRVDKTKNIVHNAGMQLRAFF